jgi:hypothetical protein
MVHQVSKVVGVLLGLLAFVAGLSFWIVGELLYGVFRYYHPKEGEHEVLHDGDLAGIAVFAGVMLLLHVACVIAWRFFGRRERLLSLSGGTWRFVMIGAYVAGHVVGVPAALNLRKLST